MRCGCAPACAADADASARPPRGTPGTQRAVAYVSIRQHTSAYVLGTQRACFTRATVQTLTQLSTTALRVRMRSCMRCGCGCISASAARHSWHSACLLYAYKSANADAVVDNSFTRTRVQTLTQLSTTALQLLYAYKGANADAVVHNCFTRTKVQTLTQLSTTALRVQKCKR